jgi:hypothetical protein
VLIGVPLQFVQALAFSMRSKPLTYPIPLLQLSRRSFPLLIGIPLGAIAFWLISSFLALRVFESGTYIFGNVSTPGIESTMTVCTDKSFLNTQGRFVRMDEEGARQALS